MGVHFPTANNSERYNGKIKERLPRGSFVWRNDQHERIATIDGYIPTAESLGRFVNIGVSDVTVVIANKELGEEVGKKLRGGIWPIAEVVLASEKEIQKLKKHKIIY